MDAIITEKTNHLLSLVSMLDKDRADVIFPGGKSPLIDGIKHNAPNALICLLSASIPQELRQASAGVIVAILLDTDPVQRYGLIISLGLTPIADFIQPLLEAVDHENYPDEIRRLSQITSRQVHFLGCNTYACAYQRTITTRSLLYALTGYAH